MKRNVLVLIVTALVLAGSYAVYPSYNTLRGADGPGMMIFHTGDILGYLEECG